MSHVLRYDQSSWSIEIDSRLTGRVLTGTVENFMRWRAGWDDEFGSHVTRVRIFWEEYNIVELGAGD